MERLNERQVADKIINDALNGYYEPMSVGAAKTNSGNTEPALITKEDIDKMVYILRNTDLVKADNGNYYVDPQSSEGPIREGEFLEPCIRGGQKILSNPKQNKMMREIYRGI